MVEIDPKRSLQMSRIRSANTKPEILVRRAIHARGFRFRLQRRDLPGRPDIVLTRHRLAIFVHGCFWHQHQGCKLASRPKTRQDYWEPKLAGNVARDARAAGALEAMGWRVQIIWECDTRKPDRLAARLDAIFREEQISGLGGSLLEAYSYAEGCGPGRVDA